MKVKFKVDADSGAGYVAVIDPSTGEHRKSATLSKGQELELVLPGVTSADRVELSDVVDSGAGEAAETLHGGQQDDGTPAGLAIGRMVIYRSRTGDYDCPAVVTATTGTLNPKGVELGHVPALSDPSNVHLTVLTPGKPGMRRGAEDFKSESEHGRSENVAGTYQEWDIPQAKSGLEPEPGTWRWPERV